MLLSTILNLPAVESLELAALDHDLGAETVGRVKVYRVPETLSADRYYISVKRPGEIEVVPPSRSRDTLLLADYDINSETGVSVRYVHPDIKAAA